ncbi:MAG: prolyl oligopeptidase family serine peptidase [Candidatus Obscuribacterales bacterium]|jgi:dipeptidyl aminopeptidase/acylaminoacyl peptidase|nr:prolyl oligopeptidase family serine peptidase [Candidatus Obscuribacterales bacterium]
MPETRGTYPAIIWGHGGFALGPSDIKDVLPFVYAGYAVMLPSWRGENGNPGNFEMCFGEVNDAISALKYLQSLPEIDANEIYAGGHSSGATIVLLMAEMTKGLKKVAACGAYPNMRTGAYEGAPFTPTDIYETELRSPAEHVRDLTCPVLLIYGDGDTHYIEQAEEMKKSAKKIGKQVTMQTIPGKDHFTSLTPAVQSMTEFFKAQ